MRHGLRLLLDISHPKALQLHSRKRLEWLPHQLGDRSARAKQRLLCPHKQNPSRARIVVHLVELGHEV